MSKTGKTTSDAREILSRRHPPSAEDLARREAFRQETKIDELINEVREKNADADPDELQAVIDEAVASVRSQPS